MWRGYPVEGYYVTCRLTGLWSTLAKVEGIVLKAIMHWGSDSSIINKILWGTRPHPIVCRPCIRVGLCVQRLYVFPPISWERS